MTDADSVAAAAPTEPSPDPSDIPPTEELLQFLSPESRADVRGLAVEAVLGITASDSAVDFFTENPAVIDALMPNTGEGVADTLKEVTYSALVNLSTMPQFATRLVDNNVLKMCVEAIASKDFYCPDLAVMVLSNLTRSEAVAQSLVELHIGGEPAVHTLIDIFCRMKPHNEKGNFHHLALVIFNITQTPAGRSVIMSKKGQGCMIQRLLPFTSFQESSLRRGGIVGALRNCCFDSNEHEWLMSEEVDLLPHLLLPLAGPEEFEEEEMDGMPIDLQYLPPEKTREPDADIRKLLLEALIQLCAKKVHRELMREQKVYFVLREYHKWEKSEDVWDVCLDLINLLIADEQDGVDNMHDVEVPAEFSEKFKKAKREQRAAEAQAREEAKAAAERGEVPAAVEPQPEAASPQKDEQSKMEEAAQKLAAQKLDAAAMPGAAGEPELALNPAKDAGKVMPWERPESEEESSDGEMDMGGCADWMDAITPQEVVPQSYEKRKESPPPTGAKHAQTADV